MIRVMKNLIISFICIIAFIAMVSGDIQSIVQFSSIDSEIMVAVILLTGAGVNIVNAISQLKIKK